MSQRFWQRIFSVLLITGLIVWVVAPSVTGASSNISLSQEASGPEVDSSLLEEFQIKGSTGYLIYFTEKPDLTAAYQMSWSERGWFVMNALQEAAKKSQAGVRNHLDHQKVSYQSFWIDNVIHVESSDLVTLNGLMSFSGIEKITAEEKIFLQEPVESVQDTNEILSVESNISWVKAPNVWAMGYNGEGVVVANIDTGVRYTHQALVNQYRGNMGDGTFNHNYNWWDPYGDYFYPYDGNGHGTHTMGTMVGDDGGDNQIGMAPGAEWIACRGCDTRDCGSAELLACAEFVSAPRNLSGQNPNPDLRAHVVNNSWGDCEGSYNAWYQNVVDNWHAFGVYPIFANGNASNCGYSLPPDLGTVSNPARYGNVTGVGSTTKTGGDYAPHSTWGPTDNEDEVNPLSVNGVKYNTLKPQVVAPGVAIRSSYKSSNTSYESFTGTSMSAPHVAGLLALVWQAAPCLMGDYAASENLLEETANLIPYDSLGNPAPPPGNVPNYATGWGEIDALAAVEQALKICGAPEITGTVTAARTGAPISGATITISGEGTVHTTSSADGTYRAAVWDGTYSVTASKSGYLPQTVSDVDVDEGKKVRVDFALIRVIDLSTSLTPILLGEPVNFTAEVINNDETEIDGVLLILSMPGNEGLDAVKVTAAGCSITNNLITCNLGSIEPGASKTVLVELVFSATGSFEIGIELKIPGLDSVIEIIEVDVWTQFYLPAVIQNSTSP